MSSSFWTEKTSKKLTKHHLRHCCLHHSAMIGLSIIHLNISPRKAKNQNQAYTRITNEMVGIWTDRMQKRWGIKNHPSTDRRSLIDSEFNRYLYEELKNDRRNVEDDDDEWLHRISRSLLRNNEFRSAMAISYLMVHSCTQPYFLIIKKTHCF